MKQNVPKVNVDKLEINDQIQTGECDVGQILSKVLEQSAKHGKSRVKIQIEFINE